MPGAPGDHEPPRPPRAPRGRKLAFALLVAAGIGAALALAPRARKSRRVSGVPAGAQHLDARVVARQPDAAAEDATAPEDAAPDAAAPTAPSEPYVELDGGTLRERNDVLITNMQHVL